MFASIFFAAAVLFHSTNGATNTNGCQVYQGEVVSSGTMSCLATSQEFFLAGTPYYPMIDTSATDCANLKNAYNYGIMHRDAYLDVMCWSDCSWATTNDNECYLCTASNAISHAENFIATYVSELKSCAGAAWSGRLWLKIYPEGSVSFNQNFYSSLVTYTQTLSGVTSVGIYSTDANDWATLYGSTSWNMPGGSQLPMSYSGYLPNFADYKEFGGWATPYMKLYNTYTSTCSTWIYKYYCPNN